MGQKGKGLQNTPNIHYVDTRDLMDWFLDDGENPGQETRKEKEFLEIHTSKNQRHKCDNKDPH